MRTFLIFPAICSANDLSEFQLHARIITRVFRGAERMIGYRGVRACPTMNSYFATRFSRYDHRVAAAFSRNCAGSGAMLHCPPIPDIALCRASRLAKILTSRTQINPVPHAGASSFLPRTSPTVCARWRIALPLLMHSAPRVARSLSMSLSIAMCVCFCLHLCLRLQLSFERNSKPSGSARDHSLPHRKTARND